VEGDDHRRAVVASTLNELFYLTFPFTHPKEIKNHKSKEKPELILTSHSLPKDLAKEFGDISLEISVSAPIEDVVDAVEKKIGLSPIDLKNRTEKVSTSTSGDTAELNREIDSLRDQIQFYQKQLDQISVAGEKESREMDLVLRDLQEDVDQKSRELISLREELKLMKNDFSKKDRDMSQRDNQMDSIKTELEETKNVLRDEIEDLKKQLEDGKEQHKKAQNALREFYKTKMDKQNKMDDELKDLEDQVKAAEKKLNENQKVIDQLENELELEKQKSKKAKEALSQLSKAFDS
jgi:chromosome segregation protein